MNLTRKIADKWNQFFFSRIDPGPLGIFRIALGIVALMCLVGRYHDRHFLYGAHAIISLKTDDQFFGTHALTRWLYFYGMVPSHDPALMWFFIGLIAIAVCVTIGFYTRVNAVLLFLGLIALSNRNFFCENSGDDLLRIFCFFLMFAPAGAAYSVDQWFAGRRRRIVSQSSAPRSNTMSAWPLRILQLQFAYVYLDTVYLKLHGTAWRHGTALYYALNYLEFKRFQFPWLFHYLWQIRIETWAVLAVETAMFTLVWFRKFRRPVLLAALALHLGIDLVMQFAIFQYVMIAGLATFLSPASRDS